MPEYRSWVALLSTGGGATDFVDRVRDRLTAAGWAVRVGQLWCSAEPPGYRRRDQGWKLHVSATPASAPDVLDNATDVLLRLGCAYKFATDTARVQLLTSRHWPRGAAGKFLTAYPDDDEHFRTVAAALDEATTGLPGPAILSDRRYQPGSLVHYRYGGFVEATRLDNDGTYQPVITGPDGTPVEDRREAWFAAPPWAPPPPVEVPQPSSPAAARPVLLGDRFWVREAIRHSTRGGVYRADDTRGGPPVVIKQARPYVEADRSGRDARDRLRHEAAALDVLAPLGLAPAKIALFEQQGDVFLAEETVAGTTLHTWVRRHPRGVPLDTGLAMAARLVAAMDAVHRAGLVLVDVSPNNIMVTDDALRFIDLECAVPTGTEIFPVATPGYCPPEYSKNPVLHPKNVEEPGSSGEEGRFAVGPAGDAYGLGALLFLLGVGTDPVLAEDTDRRADDRLVEWLTHAAACIPLAARLAPAIRGLLHADPARRWPLPRAQTALAGTPVRARPSTVDTDRLVGDGLAYLVEELDPTNRRRPWSVGCVGESADPCAVQHGAAGVLATLVQAAASAAGHLDEPSLRPAIASAARWLDERLLAEPRLLPGLYYGRSGTAWALYDAARLIGDGEQATRATDFLRRIPTRWPNPDVAHGAAGAGLAHLHIARHTGDPELIARVRDCADGIVAAAERDEGGVRWRVPAEFPSQLAGRTFHGFAHGTAGIGAFLLAAATATSCAEYLDLAAAAGDTLCDAALRDGGAAWWENEPGDGIHATDWCQGSSGVGTFLLRLAVVTGRSRYLDLARAAAVAVRLSCWRSSTATCHGVAGNGQFLLDMAGFLDEPEYATWAAEHAAALHTRRVYRNGRALVPDGTGRGIVADYATGLAGTLSFLLRLRHGGPRAWLPAPDCSDF